MIEPSEMLIDRARLHDPHAWAEIYERLSGPLFGYLFNRLRHRETAEDLLAQTFVEGLQAIERFEGDMSGLRSWLFSIARNNLFDHRRKTARVSITPIDEVGGEELARLGGSKDPEEEALSSLERGRVLEAIESLSEEQREVVLLRLTGGLRSAEIAEIIDKTPGAVKALQHRAMKSLARLLSPE